MGKTINNVLTVVIAGMIAVSAVGGYGCSPGKGRLTDTKYKEHVSEECRKYWWQGHEERNCSGDPRPDTPYNR